MWTGLNDSDANASLMTDTWRSMELIIESDPARRRGADAVANSRASDIWDYLFLSEGGREDQFSLEASLFFRGPMISTRYPSGS
jgi:hypothetical protein